MIPVQSSRLMVLIVIGLFGCHSAASQNKVEATKPAAKKSFQAVTATEGRLPKRIALTGSLKSRNETDLAANASGRILRVMFERGAEVKQGATLVVLDIQSARLAAAEAMENAKTIEVEAQTSKQDCDRAKGLLQKGAITQQEYDRIVAPCERSGSSVAAALARRERAEKTVRDGMIRAPFAGEIAERFVDVGEYVREDTKVASLVDLKHLRVEVPVPEVQLSLVKAGSPVSFSVVAYPDRVFSGVVKSVGAVVRQATRDVMVEVDVDNSEKLLRPGMFANVVLEGAAEKVALIPQTAVVTKDGKPFVFVINQGHLEERAVQLGTTPGNQVSVLRGVAVGEQLVDGPAPDLKNGQDI